MLVKKPGYAISRRREKRLSSWRVLLVGLGVGLVWATALILLADPLREACYGLMSRRASRGGITEQGEGQQRIVRLEKEIAKLEEKWERLTPRQPYVVVNTSEHRIYLLSGQKRILEGVCSTGSYILLKEIGTQRQWIFHTPRGLFHVREKKTSPVWSKPDWAFVEEGRPIPPPGSPERFEAGVLGDYALQFGDGYMIHGTLYKRSLGMPVTHGCIRVGDEDLYTIYKKVPVGGKIFIY